MKQQLLFLLLSTSVTLAMDLLHLPITDQKSTITEDKINSLASKGQANELMELFLSYSDIPAVSLEAITGTKDREPLRNYLIHTMELEEIDRNPSQETISSWKIYRKACIIAAELYHPLAKAFMQKSIDLLDQSTISSALRITALEKNLTDAQYYRALSLLRDLISETTQECSKAHSRKLGKHLKDFKEIHERIYQEKFINMPTRVHIQTYSKLQAVTKSFKDECITIGELKTFNGIEWYNLLPTSTTGITGPIKEHGILKILTGLLCKYESIINTLIAGKLREFGTLREKLFSDHATATMREEYEGVTLLTLINDYLRLYPGLPSTRLYHRFYQKLFEGAQNRPEMLEASFTFAKLYFQIIGDDASSDQLVETYNNFLAVHSEKAAGYFLVRATNALAYEASSIQHTNTLYTAKNYSLKADEAKNPTIKNIYYKIALNLGKKALTLKQSPEIITWLAKTYYKAACLGEQPEDQRDLYTKAASAINRSITLHENLPNNALRRGQSASLLYKTAAGINLWVATKRCGEEEHRPTEAFNEFLLDNEGRVHFKKEPFCRPTKLFQFLFEKKERIKAMNLALSQTHSMLETLGSDALPYHYEFALLVTKQALHLYKSPEELEAVLQKRADYIQQKMADYPATPTDYLEAFTIVDELITNTSSQLRKGQWLEVALSYLTKSISPDLSSYLKTLDTCLTLVKKHSEQKVPFPSFLREAIYSEALTISKKALEQFEDNLPLQTVYTSLMNSLGDRSLKRSSFKTTGRMAHMLCETALLCRDHTLISCLLQQGADHINQARITYPEKVWPGPEITYLLSLIYKTLSQLQNEEEEELIELSEDFSKKTEEEDGVLESIKQRYPELYLYVGKEIPEFFQNTLRRKNELEEFLGQVYQQQHHLSNLDITSDKKLYKNNRSDEFDEATVLSIENAIKETSIIKPETPPPFKPLTEESVSKKESTIERAFKLRNNLEAQEVLVKKFLRYVANIPKSKRLFLRHGNSLTLNTLGLSEALLKRALLLKDDSRQQALLFQEVLNTPKTEKLLRKKGLIDPANKNVDVTLEVLQELSQLTSSKGKHLDDLTVLMFLTTIKIWQEYHDDLTVLILLKNPVACSIVDSTTKPLYQEEEAKLVSTIFNENEQRAEICDFLLTPFFKEYSLNTELTEELVSSFMAGQRSAALSRLYHILSGPNKTMLGELLEKKSSKRAGIELEECNNEIAQYSTRIELKDESSEALLQQFTRAVLQKKRLTLLIHTHRFPTIDDYYKTFEAFTAIAHIEKDDQDSESQKITLAAAQYASETLCEMIDILGDTILGDDYQQKFLLYYHKILNEGPSKSKLRDLPQVDGLKMRKEISTYLGQKPLLEIGYILILKEAYDSLMKELALQEKRLRFLLNDSIYRDIQQIDDQLTGTLPAKQAIRLTSQKATLYLQAIPLEVTKIRNRLQVLFLEASRIYDLYVMRCFGGSTPQLESFITIGNHFKQQTNIYKNDLLNYQHASGYNLESILAYNKVTERCLLLFQSATYHVRAIDLLGESVSTIQLSDTVKICLEGYQLAQDAQLPTIQGRLASMTLSLLQKLLKLEQSNEFLRGILLSEALTISNKMAVETSAHSLFAVTQMTYLKALSLRDPSERYAVLTEAYHHALTLLTYCTTSDPTTIFEVPYEKEQLNFKEIREYVGQIILETAKSAPTDKETLEKLTQGIEAIHITVPEKYHLEKTSPTLWLNVLKALIRKEIHINAYTEIIRQTVIPGLSPFGSRAPSRTTSPRVSPNGSPRSPIGSPRAAKQLAKSFNNESEPYIKKTRNRSSSLLSPTLKRKMESNNLFISRNTSEKSSPRSKEPSPRSPRPSLRASYDNSSKPTDFVLSSPRTLLRKSYDNRKQQPKSPKGKEDTP